MQAGRACEECTRLQQHPEGMEKEGSSAVLSRSPGYFQTPHPKPPTLTSLKKRCLCNTSRSSLGCSFGQNNLRLRKGGGGQAKRTETRFYFGPSLSLCPHDTNYAMQALAFSQLFTQEKGLTFFSHQSLSGEAGILCGSLFLELSCKLLHRVKNSSAFHHVSQHI